jgi:hypothetical protein
MDNQNQEPLDQEKINKQFEEQFGQPIVQKQIALPNASGVLTLGIISIVGCICYGVVGIILSTIALIMAAKAINLYKSTPELYILSSYKNIQTGRTCAIIGLCLSVAALLISLIVSVSVAGVFFII